MRKHSCAAVAALCICLICMTHACACLCMCNAATLRQPLLWMPCLAQMFEAKHPERYTNAARAPALGAGPLWKVFFGMQFR